MKTRSTFAAEVKVLAAAGTTLEPLVAHLRAQGCSKIDSIAVLREALSIGLGEAKALVETSDAWDDVRDSDQKLWDEAERVLRGSGWTDNGRKTPK